MNVIGIRRKCDGTRDEDWETKAEVEGKGEEIRRRCGSDERFVEKPIHVKCRSLCLNDIPL